MQARYLKLKGSTESALVWMIMCQSCIWQMAWNMLEDRYKILHHPSQGSSIENHVSIELSHMSMNGRIAGLPSTYRHFFYIPLLQYMQQSALYKQK